jgi:DNA-binding SARP family transcriptional activator
VAPANDAPDTSEDADAAAQAPPGQATTRPKAVASDLVEREGEDTAALLRVRCFGGFEVNAGGREIAPSGTEGGQYKAWEVLAFLACHPDGAASREKLFAAIWPNTDPDRAANRMRVAMARLRSHLTRRVPGLGADFVRAERDGTCRLDTRVVSSDVHQFLTLCRKSRQLPPAQRKEALEKARALYCGDLLNGRGTRIYEWVHEREETGVSLREHFREHYYQVSQQLARQLLSEGQAAQAVPILKSLLKAEPTLEDVVRDLYRCYHQLGDLTALIREDRQLRQSLRNAYADAVNPEAESEEFPPEPETVELFQQIRADLEMRTLAQAGAQSDRTGRPK